MPVFSETNKCIFNYMSKNLYIVLINLQMTICQLSPFFISNFSFSILLLSFPMQKYITCLAKCFLATTALAIEVATLMYDLFPWQIVLFLPEMASATAPNFPKPLQFLFLHIIQDLAHWMLGQLLQTVHLWATESWEAQVCHLTDHLPKPPSCTTSLHSVTSFCWPSFRQEGP